MIGKARAKDINNNVILADGSRTPFREKSFDAVLMAHVFHLLDDPVKVLREAARVCTRGVFALVKKRSRESSLGQSFFWGDSVIAAQLKKPGEDSSKSDAVDTER